MVVDRPGVPGHVSVSICTSTSATVAWYEASDNNDPIIEYLVDYVATSLATISSLDASDSNLHGPRASLASSVFRKLARRPVQLFKQSTNNFTTDGRAFFRNEPFENDNEMRQISRFSFDEKVKAKMSTDLELLPWFNYTFRVAARNSLGIGQYSHPSQTSCTTPAVKPYRNPTGVCSNLTSSPAQLHIIWKVSFF